MGCSKCGQKIGKQEDLFKIKSELQSYYFCKSCIKKAAGLLGMKIMITKDEKNLLKDMRKWLKHEKAN